MTYNKYNRGSEWKKWDLHVHTPSSYDYDDQSVSNDKIIEVLKANDISAVAITDHHVIDTERIKNLQKIAGEELTIFPGIEFCSSSRGSEPIHFIGVFPENSNLDHIWNEINSKANIASQKESGKKDNEIYCDFDKTSQLIRELGGIITIHAGSKSNSIENITNSLPVTMAEKEDIAKNIDIFELGKEEDQNDYQGIVFPKIGCHPMIICSDNHDINNYSLKQSCWIKADLTFEGLKQIIYEPESGERVFIGPTKPDRKDEYKVIDKIIFDSKDKFPEEIKFNSNLCSIIGSRSSGKSALLAYVAHAIDKTLVEERLQDGPGAGIPWNSISFSYRVEWLNGSDNDKSPGQIVYIPQNYLFRISSQPDEIKNKIEPVFFNLLPDFKSRYFNALESIKNHNINIENAINDWFFNSDKIYNLTNKIKFLGDKKAIEEEIKKIETKIEGIKKKFSLTEEEVKEYQNIRGILKRKEERIKNVDSELIQISSQLESQANGNNEFFKRVILSFDPSLDNLPEDLRDKILTETVSYKSDILNKINIVIRDYKSELEKESVKLKEEINEIKEKNKPLIEKNKKNKELEELVESLNDQNILIEKIKILEKTKNEEDLILRDNEKIIKEEIKKRKSVLERLSLYIGSLNQDNFDIIFGLEYQIDGVFQESLAKKINKLESSDFFERGELKLNEIRDNPMKFIKKIYSGEQKINVGYDKNNVAKEALTLTEKILFIAEMEGDKIGGFGESTMTPGKQALFALKLILGESDDEWPLLIDQPEDDLDSRSIYDHIVPFLKKKKKERQIIMVSHNANLVIGSDSEQIIVSNRKGDDWPNEDGREFNYLSGSIENTMDKDKECLDTLKSQGIREHACDVLDGGKIAFEHRRNKYNLKK